MDVNAVQGAGPGMGAAANAEKMAQARSEEEQQVKPAVAENSQQEASKPKIPGMGENVNITV